MPYTTPRADDCVPFYLNHMRKEYVATGSTNPMNLTGVLLRIRLTMLENLARSTNPDITDDFRGIMVAAVELARELGADVAQLGER